MFERIFVRAPELRDAFGKQNNNVCPMHDDSKNTAFDVGNGVPTQNGNVSSAASADNVLTRHSRLVTEIIDLAVRIFYYYFYFEKLQFFFEIMFK